MNMSNMTDREFYKSVRAVIKMLLHNSPRCFNLDFEIITDTAKEATERFETQKTNVDMTDDVFFQNLNKIMGMLVINEAHCRDLNVTVIDNLLLEMVRRVNDLSEAAEKERDAQNLEYKKTINTTVEMLLKNEVLLPSPIPPNDDFFKKSVDFPQKIYYILCTHGTRGTIGARGTSGTLRKDMNRNEYH